MQDSVKPECRAEELRIPAEGQQDISFFPSALKMSEMRQSASLFSVFDLPVPMKRGRCLSGRTDRR